MIRVIVYDQPYEGLWSYRIDGHWGPLGAPLIGIAPHPEMEAARVLAALGVSVKTVIRFEDTMTGDWSKATIERAMTPPKHALVAPQIGGDRTADRQGRGSVPRLSPPTKALPAPQRRPRKRLLVKGSGVPGDG